MTKKEIFQKRLDQLNADVAESNRRVRGSSKGWEKEAESKMEPWRRLENPDKGGLGGKTYLHSGVTTRNRSRSAKEQIKRLNEADPMVISTDSEGKLKKKRGRITRTGKKSRKDLEAMLKREEEAKAQGLTEYEILKGKGKKNKKKKKIRSFKPKKPVTGMLEAQGY